MTMSDKKIALAHRSLTPATPLGGGSSYKKCFRSLLEMRLNLLLKLVDRFKALPSVAVKNVPYFTRAGMMVHIPGPFAIEFPRSNSNSPPATPVPPVVHEDDEGGDEVEEPEMDDNNLPNNNNSQNLATPSHDNNNNEDEDDEEFFANLLNHQNSHHRSRSSSGGKFIVRNEFAHVRIQHLLEGIENSNYGPTSFDPRTLHQYEIGGHCVLPKELFDLCIEKGWGIPHMLAGRYHPIAGNIIPETTLLFYAPRNEEELEFIWKILFQSYQWAVVDYK